MHRLLRAFILLVVALSTTGAWSADKKVMLQLRWTPQFQFAGYYIAQEKGFYQEEGLNVQIIPGEGNRTQVMEEVLTVATVATVGFVPSIAVACTAQMVVKPVGVTDHKPAAAVVVYTLIIA